MLKKLTLYFILLLTVACSYSVAPFDAPLPKPEVVNPPIVTPTQPPDPQPIAPLGEHGYLTTKGIQFIQEDGTGWRGKGFTDFLLFERYSRGEDITPILRERQALGANYLRVLMMEHYIGACLAGDCDNGPSFIGDPAKLDGFLDQVATFGERVEVVVFADAQLLMKSGQHTYLDSVVVVLNRHWNALGELCNECAKNGVDPSQFTKPNGPTLWSRGSNCCGDDGFIGPVWDYVTHHSARDNEWPRKVECRPIQDVTKVPCLEDEPMGASSTLSGSRSNNVEDFGYLGGLCSLWGAGCLFHSDSGVISTLLGDIETQAAKALYAGENFAPVEAPTWPYQRGANCGDCDGIGGMPIEQWDLPRVDGTLRSACRPAPNGQEFCAVVRPGPAWMPTPRLGFHVRAQVGPRGSQILLER